MELNGVPVEETFAEAFTSTYTRLLITAANKKWAGITATAMTGYGTSMIGCSAEAGIEGYRSPAETVDGRPGYVVQIWASKKRMKDELLGRIGQCVLTSPTASLWNYCEGEKLDVGHKMRFFGDGYEESKSLFGKEVTSIPIMLGEFLIEKELGLDKGVAGGNFLILANSQASALMAAETAVEAIGAVEGVITPFPGGICASGSKVGSKKYKFMHATTNERYCPTLAERVEGSAVRGSRAVAEIVIDGVTEEKVREAMRVGILAATRVDGVTGISAGNYGGTLGNVKIQLKELF
ncbi:MAG: formylmethanofuran--tetrahydromethanopterin N-formyltransferase [Candidatus Hydrothermarchaeota archaeon]